MVLDLGLGDLVDVLVVAALVWLALRYLRRTRAGPALLGLAMLGGVYLVANWFSLELTAALFQAFFAFQQDAMPDAGLPGLRADLAALDNGTAKFDLTLSLDRDGAGLAGHLEHSADLFDPATAARLAAHLAALLRGAVADPSRPVGLLPLLAEGEREQLLRQWGEAEPAEGEELCLHDMFAAQARRTPEAPALVSAGESLT